MQEFRERYTKNKKRNTEIHYLVFLNAVYVDRTHDLQIYDRNGLQSDALPTELNPLLLA
jgi:hypothetical protein